MARRLARHELAEFDSAVQTIYFLLEKAVKFPNQQHCEIEEIIAILKATNFDAKGLKKSVGILQMSIPNRHRSVGKKPFCSWCFE